MNIDTLSIARDLKATQLPAEQAEAIAAAIGRAVIESSATKADLELARTGLKADLDLVRASLDAKVEQVRADLRTAIERSRNQVTVWLGSTQIALAGLIIAAIKYL